MAYLFFFSFCIVLFFFSILSALRSVLEKISGRALLLKLRRIFCL